MFLRRAVAYSAGNFGSQIMLFIQGIVVRSLLRPEIMGFWNLANVIKDLVMPITIGLLNGAGRELPVLRGRGDETGQRDVRSVTLLYSLAEVILVAIGVIVYALVRRPEVAPFEFVAMLFTGLLLVWTRLQESYLTFFQGAQLYVPLSWLLFANSMIYALTLSVGAWLFGLWGVFFGALFTEALKALWMAWAASRHGLDVRPRWGPGIFKRLAIFSVIFRITTYPLTMFFMVDILWVTRFMSVGDLAVYAMARNFFIQSSVVTRNFTSVHTTQLFEQYGQKADKVKIARDMSMFIQAQLLMSVPVISWGVFWLAPFIIKQFNPLYIQGVYPLTILLIAGFFDARLNNLYSVWVAEKQMIRYGLANTISLGLMVLLISAAWFGLGTRSMTAVAWAVVCGYFANFIFMMGSVGRQIMGWRLTLEIFIKVVLAAAWTGTVFLIMSKPDAAVSPFWVDFKSTMFRAAISLALMSPLILFGIRTSGVAGRVKSWRAALAGTGRLGSDK